MPDNYPIKDGTGTSETFASKLVGGVQHPLHLLEGLFGGVPTAVNMTITGTPDVSIVAPIPAGANTIGTVNLGSLSGAATAAKQPALGTAGSAATDVITVQGIASGTPQSISASALPLPSGAATSAKQPALGTAGAASADVITVQGIASGTAQPVSAASLPLPSGASTSAKQPALGTAGTPSADVLTIQGASSMTSLKTVLYNSSGTEIDFTAASPVTQSGTWNIGSITTLPALVAGSATIGNVGLTTAGFSAAVSLTRTADTNAYLANDILGSATGSTAALSFTSMGPASSRIMITSVSLEIDVTAVPSGMTSFRLYLYNVTPPSASGDNAAFDLPSGDRASYLGYVDLGTPIDLGSTLYVQTDGVNRQVLLAATPTLFGYLVTNGAYTPASATVHKITLQAVAV